MKVLVFKTNIRYKKHINHVRKFMPIDERIIKWNIDFKDADKILRIECVDLHPEIIEKLLQKAGYQCQELED